MRLSARVRVVAPRPFQVVQRRGNVAAVRVTVAVDAAVTALEACAIDAGEDLAGPSGWTRAVATRADDGVSAAVDIPEGGWFTLRVRALDGDTVVGEGEVTPIGAGEVFLVGGQSYACGAHERLFTVRERAGRVSTTGPEEDGWRVAHDPPPAIVARMDEPTRAFLAELVASGAFPLGEDNPHRGSVWPLVGDALVEGLRVPVAFVHAGLGATTIAQWQKPGQLYTNLVDAARIAGDHRAVLWALGESDAQLGTSRMAFAAGMRRLREDLVAVTGVEAPWVVAKSTIHPTASSNPVREFEIRAAVDELWATPGFVRGPDTDTLDGDAHRATVERGGHFTEEGQRRAAELWVDAVEGLVRNN